jgi:DNA-binding NarL/FixJ family response regulator
VAEMMVVLASAQPLLRLGMRMACERAGIAVAAEADDGAALSAVVAPMRDPSVVVTDVAVLEPESVTAVRELSAAHRVLVLEAGWIDRPRLLRAGASGFLQFGTGAADLCAAVLSAFRGELVLGAAASHDIALDRSAPHLTPRELAVLRLIAAGRSTNAAAVELHLSGTTLKTHLRNASAKLGTPNRSAAVARATALGLLA